jgi:odorant receptor
MFNKIKDAISYVASFVGCHSVTPDYKIFNPIFCLLVIDLVTYLAISFENIYAFSEDFERQVFCVVTLGMGFQGTMQIYTFVFDKKRISELFKQAEAFHKSSQNPKTVEAFEKWMMIAAHVTAFFFVAYLICASLMFSYPAIFYLIVGKKVLHFGFVFPDTDPETLQGYTINFMFHTVQFYAVPVALFVTTCFPIFLMINAFAKFDSLEIEVESLGELVKGIKKNSNDEIIKMSIKTITDEHVKLLE